MQYDYPDKSFKKTFWKLHSITQSMFTDLTLIRNLSSRRWHCSPELVNLLHVLWLRVQEAIFWAVNIQEAAADHILHQMAYYSVILYCTLDIISVLSHFYLRCRSKTKHVDTHGFILKRSWIAPGVLAPGGLGCSPSHLASLQVIWTAVLGVTASVAGDCGVAGVGGLVLLSWMSCSCGGWDTVTHCRGRARYNTYTWTVWGQRRNK